MTSLTELIEALREAKEGSRALDCKIWLALFDKPIMTDGGAYGKDAHGPEYTPARQIWTDDWPHWDSASEVHSVGLFLDAPFYTTSLDAALTLVPEGWAWMVGCDHDYAFFADLSTTEQSGLPYATLEGKGATAPLALTIAALSSLPSDTEVKE